MKRLLAITAAVASSYVFGFVQTFAQTDINYTPLSRNPPLIGTTVTSVPDLLNALLGLSVGVAAVLAVIMLAIGGFKYMTTDSMFALGNAKEQIANAIIGLLIVLTAILILRTINPEIVSLNFFG